MAKSKKTRSIPLKRESSSSSTPTARKVMINLFAVLVLLSGSVVGMSYARKHVDRKLAFYSHAPTVVLKNRPAWMSDFLAAQITSSAQPLGAHSTFDHQMLVDVADSLRTNPWIRQVRQVRRAYAHQPGDTIEIDCEYRVPLALVHWKDFFWLVDGDGVKLPEQFTQQQLPQISLGQDHKLLFRIIEGVRQPPVEPGRKWAGDDLAAGLTLARYLAGQPFTEEITRIDVSNFAGRVDPKEAQLVLLTSRGTEIRWGRPVDAKDFFVEVSVAQKLDYLRRVWEQFGQVDAKQAWIDIRFDKITYPSSDSQARLDAVR